MRALVGEHLKIDIAEASRLGGGASVLASGEGWMYFPTVSPGLLGTAVIWGAANDCERMNLIVDDSAEALAHAASMFADPPPRIWVADDRTLVPATPSTPDVAPPPECVSMTAELASAGLDVVADHGVWLGEINGLEVARVGLRDGECSMDIGVGAYDQFASAALSVDRDDAETLAQVVSMVRPHRIAGAAPHAIGRLVRARWLRAQVMREPSLVGLDRLNPIPLLRPRPGLMETQPAAALGVQGESRSLVVFAVGLDLGLAETAAGLAAVHSADEGNDQIDDIVLVLPGRDRHQRIIDSVAALRIPAKVVAVEGEWAT